MDSSNILSKFKIKTKNYNLEFLKELPFDQYLCPECKEIPEILNIDYDKKFLMELFCKNHGKIEIPIEDYFHKESKYLYINEICGKDGVTLQKNYKKSLFDFCPGCNFYLCGACAMIHMHQSNFCKINEFNSLCIKHLKQYTKYCIACNKHYCNEDDICNVHEIEELKCPNESDINILLNERENLLKKKELIEHLIKLINTLLETYIEHPGNFFHTININNMAEIIKTNHRNKINREALLSKVCNLEKIALYYLNVKFKMELTGNEVKIDLNGKNIGNFDFGLLSQIPFKNAESINLSHNEISDLKPLEKLKFPQLKHLDLSFNKIEDLSPFKKYSKNEQKIETILLNNNNISNADIFKEKRFQFIKDINLDENKLLSKDIQEIKDAISGKLKSGKKYKLKKVSSQLNIRYKGTDKNNNPYIPFGKLPLIGENYNPLIAGENIQRKSFAPK